MSPSEPLLPLEKRLQTLEDRLEIYNLLAAHPLSADTGADYYSKTVYLPDGVFDRGDLSGAVGNEAIGDFMLTPAHQQAIHGGLAHIASLPHIQLAGDEAFVTSYVQILYPDRQGEDRELANHGSSRGYRIHRVLANRWHLVRTPAGWRIERRTLLPLDGTSPARDLLAQGLADFRPASPD